MKKIFIGLMLLAGTVTLHAQTAAPNGQATAAGSAAAIAFKEANNTHDFGTIPQGTPVTYNFSFTNSGKAPLTLSSVQPSCGCTSPEWPKEPIAPGKSATIKVTYNAAALGTFNKTITVVSNSASNPTTILYIKGEVKGAAAPAQAGTAPQQAAAPKKN
jgi:hypothetical protein